VHRGFSRECLEGALMSLVLFKGVMFVGGNSVKLEMCTEGI